MSYVSKNSFFLLRNIVIYYIFEEYYTDFSNCIDEIVFLKTALNIKSFFFFKLNDVGRCV